MCNDDCNHIPSDARVDHVPELKIDLPFPGRTKLSASHDIKIGETAPIITRSDDDLDLDHDPPCNPAPIPHDRFR